MRPQIAPSVARRRASPATAASNAPMTAGQAVKFFNRTGNRAGARVLPRHAPGRRPTLPAPTGRRYAGTLYSSGCAESGASRPPCGARPAMAGRALPRRRCGNWPLARCGNRRPEAAFLSGAHRGNDRTRPGRADNESGRRLSVRGRRRGLCPEGAASAVAGGKGTSPAGPWLPRH